jgi:hypothetical protein
VALATATVTLPSPIAIRPNQHENAGLGCSGTLRNCARLEVAVPSAGDFEAGRSAPSPLGHRANIRELDPRVKERSGRPAVPHLT